jgi:thiol-disulfide isomerase/thioredoxin
MGQLTVAGTLPAMVTLPATSTSPATSTLQATSTLPGYAAADFDLAALNAGVEKISLESLKGRPVVLNFFATWCTTCRQEIPRLAHAYTQNEGKIHFIAIDLGDSLPGVKKFIREMGIPYPVLLDHQRASERSYQIRGIPTTYFLDSNGRIVDMYLGVIPEKILKQRLNQLIGR